MEAEAFTSIIDRFPYGSRWMNQNDDFKGSVIGWYVTRENKLGVTLQLDNARVVHVYNIKWLDPC